MATKLEIFLLEELQKAHRALILAESNLPTENMREYRKLLGEYGIPFHRATREGIIQTTREAFGLVPKTWD